MTDIPIFDFTLPSRRQSQEDFDANFQNLIDRLPSMVNGMNLLASELNALIYATNYNPATLYNPTGYTRPSAVYGTDGHTYVCLGSNVIGDNPVGSTSGDWLRLTIATSEIVNRTSREIIGGDIIRTTDDASTLSITPCRCWDETGSVFLQSSVPTTGVSWGNPAPVMNGGEALVDIYFCRRISDGVCEFRFYLDGFSHPSTDASVDAWRWVDFGHVLKYTPAALIYRKWMLFSGVHIFLEASDSILSPNITTTFAEVDHSGMMPVERISMIEYGARDLTTAGSIWASDYGGSRVGFVVGSTATTATDTNQDAWGAAASQKAGLKPFNPNRLFRASTGTLDLLVQQVVLKRQ